MTVTVDAPVRCSDWARASSLSPAGTAGDWTGFLLVETPLPWPHDVGELPDLAELAETFRSAGLRIRIQAIMAMAPRQGAGLPPAQGGRRVVLHLSGPDSDVPAWFSRYRRFADRADAAGLGGAVGRLLDAALAEGPATTTPATGHDHDDPIRSDLLVCTHGRRDLCCGSKGTELAIALAGSPSFRGPGPADQVPGPAKLWRTSHTGGHRFAPTFLHLPEGTAWAYADETVVGQVIARSTPFSDLAGHYRGCAGLGAPQIQVLEREVLIREGWEILDRPRRGWLEGDLARLEVQDGAGGVDRWEAQVLPGRTLPVPDCGRPISEAHKSETEWKVVGLRQV